MKKKIKLIAAVAVMQVVALTLTACAGEIKSLDVVGKESITTFDEVLKTVPEAVSADEMNGGWSLVAPDESVRFIWSEDYSQSPMHDVMLELDAQPFLDAGLDPKKLPDNYNVYETESGDGTMLMVGRKLGADELTYDGSVTPLAAYEQLVGKYRDAIGYHASLDHYGVKLGDGNMFEWAKDMSTNTFDKSNQDKDIVFVLNPEPLLAAGVDPEKVQGWKYAQVEVEEDGKPVQVWKFLKPFDLK
ncbi:hypothetical protein Ami103574_10225 [Aminipila butyrica]|uniref:Lipoprotein n=2 Tax=Aminipila butyrica TaxID=433296 RepID=A0A858C020_9FIRM|nr:hypothetical protein Ami103574_10225 [Aminipila butyrica]